MFISKLKRYYPQWLAAFPPLLAFFTVATQAGWTSPALQQLQSGNYSMTMTHEQGSWFVGIMSLSHIPGALGLLLVADWLGRKPPFAILSVPMLISWCLYAFTDDFYVMLLARFLGGFSIGMATITVPIYLCEIASNEIRGALGSMIQVVSAVGPILEYAIVPWIGYKISAAISAVIPVITLVLLIWLPETPYFLLMKNKNDMAKQVLRTLRGTTDVEDELNIMQHTVECHMENPLSWREIFVRKNTRTALKLMLITYTIQAFIGTPVMVFYTHVIIDQVQVSISTATIAFILIIVPCISSTFATIFVDRIGKKPLLIISLAGCFLMMLGVGVYFHLESLNYNVTSLGWLPISCLVMFKFISALGIAGIPFVQLGEFFQTNVKVYAVAICKIYLYLIHFICTKLFQTVSDSLAVCVPFYTFAFVSLVGVFFIVFMIPETSGKSLQDIQILLGAEYRDETRRKIKQTEFDPKLKS